MANAAIFRGRARRQSEGDGATPLALLAQSPPIAFLVNEFWILSWNASVQRALKHGASVDAAHRMSFRSHVIDFCHNKIMDAYLGEISADTHCAHIQAIRTFANDHPTGRQLARPYTIGNAQKLLNLQLKYFWCAGLAPRPPHCPVDRIILSHTRLRDSVAWTRIDDIQEYHTAIDAIQETAGDMHIADWELATFDRRMHAPLRPPAGRHNYQAEPYP